MHMTKLFIDAANDENIVSQIVNCWAGMRVKIAYYAMNKVQIQKLIIF